MIGVLLVAVALVLGGCASVVKGTTQPVMVTSEPQGATFNVSPSGQSGITPVEITLERKFDYIFEFSLPGHETHKAYVRRARAMGPEWGNAAGCLVIPFGCLIASGIDENSGAMFDLVPNPLHVELKPGLAVPAPPTESRVEFFNAAGPIATTFSIDGGEECRLGRGEFATRTLTPGSHRIDAWHWDLFKIHGESTLDFDRARMFVAMSISMNSTNAAFDNERPADFTETCVVPP